MTVTLEKTVATDLIKFKLGIIRERIQKILKKWNEENINDFIQKTRSGKLKDAELDTISIRQLSNDYNRLQNLLKTICLDEGA